LEIFFTSLKTIFQVKILLHAFKRASSLQVNSRAQQKQIEITYSAISFPFKTIKISATSDFLGKFSESSLES
jgi:hypothetical protein